MRLIDVDNLLRGLCDWQYGAFSEKGCETEYAILESVLDGIQRQPTIEAVPVVRCKDCKYAMASSILPTVCVCTHGKGLVDPSKESFCSYGERRADNGI